MNDFKRAKFFNIRVKLQGYILKFSRYGFPSLVMTFPIEYVQIWWLGRQNKSKIIPIINC